MPSCACLLAAFTTVAVAVAAVSSTACCQQLWPMVVVVVVVVAATSLSGLITVTRPRATQQTKHFQQQQQQVDHQLWLHYPHNGSSPSSLDNRPNYPLPSNTEPISYRRQQLNAPTTTITTTPPYSDFPIPEPPNMTMLSTVTQKMNQLRLEADESNVKVDELQNKVKVLEQENLSKEQEITSLQHKNGLLEADVEKLETAINDFKKAAEDGTQHSTTNESLTRRLQLLEEEAEEADKTLREANEKWVAQYYTFQSHDYLTWRCLPHCPVSLYAILYLPSSIPQALTPPSYPIPHPHPHPHYSHLQNNATFFEAEADIIPFSSIVGSGKPTSRPATSSEKSRLSSPSGTSGRPSTRKCPRSTQRLRRSWRISSPRLATSRRRKELARDEKIPMQSVSQSIRKDGRTVVVGVCQVVTGKASSPFAGRAVSA